jgi:hypothetical protein
MTHPLCLAAADTTIAVAAAPPTPASSCFARTDPPAWA